MPTKLSENTSQITPRSKLIALARLLDLVDANTARQLVSEARTNPSLTGETQREALGRLVESGAFSDRDLRILGEFVGNLNADFCWLLGAEQEVADAYEPAESSAEYCSEESTAYDFSIESGDRRFDSGSPVAEQKPSRSKSDQKRASQRNRSSRGRKKHSGSSLKGWDQPTLGTRLAVSVRRLPKVAAGVGKYWFEAIQDWISSHVMATGIITGLVTVSIIALGSWSYFGNAASPVKLIAGQGRPAGTSTPGEVVEPAEKRLADVERHVDNGDFDTALQALAALKRSDLAASRGSQDLAWVESGLLLGQGSKLDWEKGGETVWHEAGRLLLVEPKLDSSTWRLQFATWLLKGSEEDRAVAMETLVTNALTKDSVNYQIQAWMEARGMETNKALRFLSSYKYERCEIGDLLFRLVSNFGERNIPAAREDFDELTNRLNPPTELNLHERLCFPQLKAFANDFYVRKIQAQAEKSSVETE